MKTLDAHDLDAVTGAAPVLSRGPRPALRAPKLPGGPSTNALGPYVLPTPRDGVA